VKLLRVILCVLASVGAGVGVRAALDSRGDDEPSRSDLRVFDGDGYSVDLPGEPEREVLSIPTDDGEIELVVHYVARDSSVMGVATGKTPRGEKPDLTGAIFGTALATGGMIEDEAATRHRGLRARDARISSVVGDDGDTDATLFVRVIAKRDRLYQLQYIVAGERTSPPEVYDAFVRSFRVRPGT
jgi:hypothetical protein